MKELATGEAKKLKKFATKDEIDNLNLKQLDPADISRCIYGQMTGDCNSRRAQELIGKCCTQVYDTALVSKNYDINAQLNGKPFEIPGERHTHYQSPIEMLIYDSNGGFSARKKIIAFLKGETETLSL